ncbi:MAG: efflux RND transporter periplasmic adaptor subunit [Parachlamydiaceae bacterium]|nr:efflux RND transporter periplasmic adaptor subunit [Parachlamydiaceae bacterium]
MLNRKWIIYPVGFCVLGTILGASIYFNNMYPLSSNAPENNEIAETTPPGSDQKEKKETLVKLTDDQIKDLKIDIKPAGSGQISLTLAATGKIVLPPDQMAYILPTVSGVVKEAKKNVGETVKAGEVIAIIESKEMAKAKSDYLTATNDENSKGISFDREQKLYNKGISSAEEYLTAKTEYEKSQIHLQYSKQRLYTLGLQENDIVAISDINPSQLRTYEIRAPIDGIITNRTLIKGQHIDADAQKPIYQIADLNTVWVDIGISSRDFYQLKAGQSVEISLPTENKSSQAKIVYLNPVIEEDSILAKATAELNNEKGDWYPGTFVKVNILMEKVPSTYVVPKTALQTIDGKDCLFIVCPNGFEKQIVKVGRSDHDSAEILAGIDNEDQYAATNSFSLKAELNKNLVEDDD